MKKRYLLILIIFSLLYFFLKSSLNSVNAQANLSITAYPDVQDINVKAGENRHFQIQFKNNTTSPIVGTVHVADFIVTDNAGAVSLIEGNAERPKFAASKWISFSQSSYSIPQKDFVPVDVFVSVPQTVTNCGNYALIYFQPDSSFQLGLGGKKVNSASAVTAKIGALVNFSVTDTQCVENVSISSFTMPSFQEFGPVTATFELRNNGNIHISPKGYITMTNLLGRDVDNQKMKDQRIFPETLKIYDNQLGRKWMIGRYKVVLTAFYGTAGNKLERVSYIWVFPWRVSLIVLFTLIILYLLIKAMVDRSRGEKIHLEKELEEEKSEIEKLKGQLRKRSS